MARFEDDDRDQYRDGLMARLRTDWPTFAFQVLPESPASGALTERAAARAALGSQQGCLLIWGSVPIAEDFGYLRLLALIGGESRQNTIRLSRTGYVEATGVDWESQMLGLTLLRQATRSEGAAQRITELLPLALRQAKLLIDDDAYQTRGETIWTSGFLALSLSDRRAVVLSWLHNTVLIAEAVQSSRQQLILIHAIAQAWWTAGEASGQAIPPLLDQGAHWWAESMSTLAGALIETGRRDAEYDLVELGASTAQTAIDLCHHDPDWLWGRGRLILGWGQLVAFSMMEDGSRLEEALRLYDTVAAEFPRETESDLWARAQMGRARALRFQGVVKGQNDLLEQAKQAQLAALDIFRPKQAMEWGTLQNERGIVLLHQGLQAERGPGLLLLKQSLVHHEAALRAFTRNRFSSDWAHTQVLIALVQETIAFWKQGEPDYDEAFARDTSDAALASYNAAFEVFTREAIPIIWARTQWSVGNLLLRRSTLPGESRCAPLRPHLLAAEILMDETRYAKRAREALEDDLALATPECEGYEEAQGVLKAASAKK